MVPRSERPMYRGNLWLIFITEISSLHFSKKMAREKYHLQPSDWSYFEFIFTISSGTLIIHLILKSLNFCHLKIISRILLIQTSVTLPLTSLLDDKLDSTFTEKKEAREDPINMFTNMSIYLPPSSCITTDLLLLWMDGQLLHCAIYPSLSCNSTILLLLFCCCCYAFSWVTSLSFCGLKVDAWYLSQVSFKIDLCHWPGREW